MRRSVSIGIALLLVLMIGACKAGPPAISELKVGKTADAAQPANSFDARETIYAVGTIDNPPADGKVSGRLIVVNVEGQQPGPIPGLETSMALTAGMNKANFEFTAPTAGWPNGTYQLEVVLLDGSGAEKDKKTAEFSTAGNAPAAAPAAEAPAAEGTDTATEGESDTAGGEETQT